MRQSQSISLPKSRRLIFTRIESTALPGVPDLLICDESGKFHMVELKFITANAVSLRPHQVSWLTKHGKSSSWILVKKQKSNMDNWHDVFNLICPL